MFGSCSVLARPVPSTFGVQLGMFGGDSCHRGAWGQWLRECSLEFALLVSIRTRFRQSILEGLGAGQMAGRGGVVWGSLLSAVLRDRTGCRLEQEGRRPSECPQLPQSGTGMRQTGLRSEVWPRVEVWTFLLSKGFVEALPELGLEAHSCTTQMWLGQRTQAGPAETPLREDQAGLSTAKGTDVGFRATAGNLAQASSSRAVCPGGAAPGLLC